jgi:outer membrane protein TolC
MLKRAICSIVCIFYLLFSVAAQQKGGSPDSAAGNSFITENVAGDTDMVLTLTDCLKYAFKNQPALNQSYIDEAITRKNNQIAVSNWLPQITGAANYEHYFQLPVVFSLINNQLTQFTSGLTNTSIPSLTATQTLFSPDVLLAARASKWTVTEAKQNTVGTKIDLVSDVSKAFYDLLLSVQQINVYKEDTSRLKKNQSDTYHQYVSGIVDKVDYKQASITLNNSMSQLKTAMEAVDAKKAVLKQLMGFPSEKEFTVHFDTTQMMQEILIDTLAPLQFEKRIEYQQLQTAKRLQQETTMYYQLGFLPTLSAFYNYNYEFESNQFSNLYDHAYPYSLFGLQLNIPIFTGFRRIENVRKAQLQEKRIDWDEVNLKLTINSQYRQALANYKSNLYYLHAQGDNVAMAREVYNIVKLQYREGIKAYLDVIVAESDLQTSEIGYLNALFQLLQSKIDLEKAMGDIPTNI